MPIGASGPLGKAMKRSTFGARRSKAKAHKTENRFGGVAEVSFLTPWG